MQQKKLEKNTVSIRLLQAQSCAAHMFIHHVVAFPAITSSAAYHFTHIPLMMLMKYCPSIKSIVGKLSQPYDWHAYTYVHDGRAIA
jgi:hypothetical protein